MGKFIITKRRNGEYQFHLEAGNGRTILTSEGYAAKASCKNGIESVRTNAAPDSRYDKKISTNSKYYFNLKAGNGEIIGTSEMYESSYSRDNGIAAVKENAPGALIIDETI